MFVEQSWKSGWLILLLHVLFFPVGFVAAAVMCRTVRMALPVCAKHRGHWFRRTLFTCLGWFLVPIGLGLGFLFEHEPEFRHVEVIPICLLAGAALYLSGLGYFRLTRIAADNIGEESVTLRRVAVAFARGAARRR